MAFTSAVNLELRTAGSDTNGGGFVVGASGADFSQQDAKNIAANNTTTTLAVAITTTGAATCTLTSIPALYKGLQTTLVGDWIQIDSEIILISAATPGTGVCGTIARGQLGTTAATHLIGATVTNISNVSTTDLVTAGNTVLSSATAFFSANAVGNILYVAGGSATITAAWYRVVSVSTSGSNTTATVDRLTGLTTGTGATLNIGGALLTPGTVAALLSVSGVTGMTVHQKSGTYLITSASTNVAGGCVSLGTVGVQWFGYGSTRLDFGTPPVLQASGIATATLFSISSGSLLISNLTADGNSLTGITGFNTIATSSNLDRCIAKNCKASGFTINAPVVLTRCIATNITGGAGAFNASSTAVCIECMAYSNTVTGFFNSGIGEGTWVGCLSINNIGSALVHGFNGGTQAIAFGCTAYGNRGAGFTGTTVMNCIAEANLASGFVATGNPYLQIVNSAAFNNTGSNFLGYNAALLFATITYTATAFVAAGSGNFALNTSPGGGALLVGKGFNTMPDGLSIGFPDIGAIQSNGNIYVDIQSPYIGDRSGVSPY